jgi:threonine 3-dehydrogenase
MAKMKALVKKQPGRGLWLEEVEIPVIGPTDILIKVKKSAICGTDLHIYKWDEWSQKTIKTPMTIGHEYMGTVAEIGSAVQGFATGQRVTGEGHIACGRCRNCRRGMAHVCEKTQGIGVHRDGSFAEYVSVPAANVIPLNPKISDDVASIFDPFGNAAHTALSFPLVGEDVLITGAGLIGCMAVAICRFAGARHIVVTDFSDYRLELAQKLGRCRAVNPGREKLDAVVKELDIKGFEIGLEMSGAPQAFKDMIDHMYNGGKIALLGILPGDTCVPWDKIIFKALHLKGIYGREMFETWYKMESMLLSGLDITPMITHRFPVAGFQEGFDIMEEGKCGKVVLSWE